MLHLYGRDPDRRGGLNGGCIVSFVYPRFCDYARASLVSSADRPRGSPAGSSPTRGQPSPLCSAALAYRSWRVRPPAAHHLPGLQGARASPRAWRMACATDACRSTSFADEAPGKHHRGGEGARGGRVYTDGAANRDRCAPLRSALSWSSS